MLHTYRFQNPGPDIMVVRVEMWCEEFDVPAGSALVLICEGSANRPPVTIERTDEGIVFWPECASFRAQLDGRPYNNGYLN